MVIIPRPSVNSSIANAWDRIAAAIRQHGNRARPSEVAQIMGWTEHVTERVLSMGVKNGTFFEIAPETFSTIRPTVYDRLRAPSL